MGTRPVSRPTDILSSSPAPPTTIQHNPKSPAQDLEPAHEEGERHQTADDNEVEEDEDREDQESSPTGRNKNDSNDGGEAQEEKPLMTAKSHLQGQLQQQQLLSTTHHQIQRSEGRELK